VLRMGSDIAVLGQGYHQIGVNWGDPTMGGRGRYWDLLWIFLGGDIGI